MHCADSFTVTRFVTWGSTALSGQRFDKFSRGGQERGKFLDKRWPTDDAEARRCDLWCWNLLPHRFRFSEYYNQLDIKKIVLLLTTFWNIGIGHDSNVDILLNTLANLRISFKIRWLLDHLRDRWLLNEAAIRCSRTLPRRLVKCVACASERNNDS